MAGASKTLSRVTAFDLASVVAGIGLVFGAVSGALLVAGWRYARTYLGAFQLGPQVIDPSYDRLLFYGFWVTTSPYFWLWLPLVLAAWVGVYLWRPWRYFDGHSTPLIVVGLLLALPIYKGVDCIARQVAMHDFTTESSNAFPYHRRVKVFVEEPLSEKKSTPTGAERLPMNAAEASPENEHFPSDLAQGCYRLLVKDDDILIVFRPVKGLEEAPPTVFVMPWEQVFGFWILGDSNSCP